MMTPEQQQAFRTRIQSDAISGVALDRIVAAVDDLLAAERAATVDYVVAWLASSGITTTQQEDALRAAIRAQGGGK